MWEYEIMELQRVQGIFAKLHHAESSIYKDSEINDDLKGPVW